MSIIERERVTEVTVTTRDVLHRAADLIEEFGHTKRDLGGKDRGFCAVGAWHEAAHDLGEDGMALASAGDDALRAVGLNWVSLMLLNNAWDTTSQEVVAKLRGAAEASA